MAKFAPYKSIFLLEDEEKNLNRYSSEKEGFHFISALLYPYSEYNMTYMVFARFDPRELLTWSNFNFNANSLLVVLAGQITYFKYK